MPQQGERRISSDDEPPKADRLDSWKEIASYLGRDVRTVQRWEKEEGLPVHRQAHKKLGTVYAFKGELDAWLRQRRLTPEATAPENETYRWGRLAAVAGIAFLLVTAMVLSSRWGQQPEVETLVFRQITTDTGLTWQPAVSPKGDLVAYASDRGTEGNLDIWVQQTARGNAIRLTTSESDDSQPAFSPDGASIAFRSERDGGGIYAVPVLGGTARKLTEGGWRPRYSPDGKWIAYWVARRPDRFGTLHVIPAGGGQAKQLTPGSLSLRSPVWAPDSRHLLIVAWSASPKLGIDWYVIDSETGSLVPTGAAEAFRLADLARRRFSPALFDADVWILETGEVIFSGESGDSTNLWKIPISPKTWKVAGAPRRLTSGSGLELHGSVSRAGVLVFSSATENADIWSLPIDTNHPQTGGEITRLTSNAADDLSPSISADGKRIVFESLRTGKRLVWKKDLETGQETELVMTPSDEALPKITADGSIVAYLAANYQKHKALAVPAVPDMYTVPFKGGHPRRMCEKCGILGGWSPDSTAILYEDAPAMSVLNPASGSRHKILDETGHTFWNGRFSPDGGWIAFTAATGPAHAQQVVSFAARIRNRQQRIPRAEWVPMKVQAGVNWSPSGALLYGTAPTDGSVCLWVTRLNPVTKQPVSAPQPVYHFHRARLTFIEDPAWRGISVARDKIVFTLKELRGNIWTATPSQQTD